MPKFFTASPLEGEGGVRGESGWLNKSDLLEHKKRPERFHLPDLSIQPIIPDHFTASGQSGGAGNLGSMVFRARGQTISIFPFTHCMTTG
jgi:hypothetical protein